MGKPLPATESPPARLASVDAYRGLVMFLMMAEVLRLASVSAGVDKVSPGSSESSFWHFLAWHQTHVDWVGCTLHDLIQPSFSFLVGVALPFSLAARAARGQSTAGMTVHAFWRAFLLVALGVFLRSIGRPETNFTFEDTLSQIGLGYGFLFLLGLTKVRWQWAAFALIIVGYWVAFVLYPLPDPDFNRKMAGVSPDWPHDLGGIAAHFNKNTNLAWAFDVWWMNLWPRAQPFLNNGGGYATLSFVPTLATMILGLIAGGVLRSDRTSWQKVLWFAAAGIIALAAGSFLGAMGVCPVVKRIWTPSWVLFSGGWCFLFLAGFYALIDATNWGKWVGVLAFPLVVIGANSIAAYCMNKMFRGFIMEALPRHLGADTFKAFGEPYQPLLLGAATLLVLWLILLWMYRRKLFLKI